MDLSSCARFPGPYGTAGSDACSRCRLPLWKRDEDGHANSSGSGFTNFGIDAAGDVTGFYADRNGVLHGFVWAASGTSTSIDAPGAGTVRTLGTLPFAIDAAGDVTGFDLDTNKTAHGFLRSASGTITDFDVSGAGTSFFQGTFPLTINSSGVITGLEIDTKLLIHGFTRVADGTITTFDVPGAGTSSGSGEQQIEGSGGFSINDSGEIAGSYLDASSVSHGFVYAAPKRRPPVSPCVAPPCPSTPARPPAIPRRSPLPRAVDSPET